MNPKAYLAGCLKGDAFMSIGHKNSVRGYMGLRVSDWDFAHAFAESINVAYGLNIAPRADERGFALVRTYNGHGRFDELRQLKPDCPESGASWLRGLFDSEGNAACRPLARGPRSWDRRVTMFSTNVETLSLAESLLTSLDIGSKIVPWNHGPGHKGTKPVFAVRLHSSLENYQRFASGVGSSIQRKQQTLDLCHTTYVRRGDAS